MLVELTVQRFRNLAAVHWRPGPGCHLLTGDNGAGKTSLLEAVYALATTRSFRTTQIADCRQHGAEEFRLAGEVDGVRRVRLEVSWSRELRQRRVNSRTGSLAEHLAVQPVVSWTARDTELFTGGPEVRRRFLDRGILGLWPAELALLHRYRRTLAHKRRLLQEGHRRLEHWNQLLAAAAVELIARRREYAERLQRSLDRVLEEMGLGYPPIGLRYRPSPAEGWSSAEELATLLDRQASRELERRRPLVGPQRDDLEVRWGGEELRRVASAGERKAVGLALLAAHGRILASAGRDPLYLLDDADTELSGVTLASLWRAFAAAGQLFATSNRPQIWSGLKLDRGWRLEAGELFSEDPGKGLGESP